MSDGVPVGACALREAQEPGLCAHYHMILCMYVCVCVCMYVCMHACVYVCVRVCLYLSMHVCVYDTNGDKGRSIAVNS